MPRLWRALDKESLHSHSCLQRHTHMHTHWLFPIKVLFKNIGLRDSIFLSVLVLGEPRTIGAMRLLEDQSIKKPRLARNLLAPGSVLSSWMQCCLRLDAWPQKHLLTLILCSVIWYVANFGAALLHLRTIKKKRILLDTLQRMHSCVTILSPSSGLFYYRKTKRSGMFSIPSVVCKYDEILCQIQKQISFSWINGALEILKCLFASISLLS